jgi:iron(III) transport system substrate-binding protein
MHSGVLEAYRSPAAGAIPDAYKDPNGYWTGFAARGRVVIYNTNLTDGPPRSVRDFLDPKWSGKAAIANPLFGTTAMHAAALFAVWGENEAKDFFRRLKANNIAVLPGNATVRDLVARGEYAVGLTDTDDANGAIEDGYPVGWHLVDARPDGLGALIIPNTVALIRGGPNPDAARKFIDFLLSPEVELALSRMRSLQIPLNPAVQPPETVPKLAEIRMMDVTFDAVGNAMAHSSLFIQNEFLP